MTMNNSIIGHIPILELFRHGLREDRIGHAYCFVGPEHVGKETVATYVAAQILGISVLHLSTSPDITFIERLFDEKTEKTKKDISIDQIKELSQFLARSALKAGGHKIAIIKDADRMSVSAQNALLKTLEEPSSKTHLFLLTTNDTFLLPTIRSRCHMIRFSPVDTLLIEENIKQRDISSGDANTMARLSRGLPGLAISWYYNREEFDAYKAEVNRFVDLFGKTLHEKIKMVESMFGDKTDAVGTRQDIKETLRIWRLVMRDMWLTLHEHNHLALHHIPVIPTFSSEQMLHIDASVVEAEKMLERNIHPRLLLEQILLRIP